MAQLDHSGLQMDTNGRSVTTIVHAHNNIAVFIIPFVQCVVCVCVVNRNTVFEWAVAAGQCHCMLGRERQS